MGYIITPRDEDKFLSNIEEYIQENWDRLYQYDIDRAYPRRNIAQWHRYLLYCQQKGWINSFQWISKDIKVPFDYHSEKTLIKYIYYPDFLVDTLFGLVYDDVTNLALGARYLSYLRATNLPIRIVEKKHIKEIREVLKGEANFSNYIYDTKFDSLKYRYKHIK
jgi:hypothetical protein